MRLQFISIVAIAFWPLSAPAFGEGAASTNVRFPSIGIVFDTELRALRRISGIPGAALIGPGIDVGFPISTAAISRELVLVSSADDGNVRSIRFGQDGVSISIIEDTITAPDWMIISPSGSAVVISGGGLLQVISGFPGVPTVSRRFSVSPTGIVTTAAVSDDASTILFITGENGAEGLWRLDTHTGRSENVLQGMVAAVALRPGTADAVAVAAAGELYNLPAKGGYRKITLITESSSAVGTLLSADGMRAYAAYADGLLAVVDLGTGVIKTISCRCKPSGLHATSLSSIFRLNEPSSGTVILFDVSGSEARTWFVPPDRISQGGEDRR